MNTTTKRAGHLVLRDGVNLGQRMQQKQYTGRDLAQSSGLNAATISLLKSGKQRAIRGSQYDKVRLMCKALDMPMSLFFTHQI